MIGGMHKVFIQTERLCYPKAEEKRQLRCSKPEVAKEVCRFEVKTKQVLLLRGSPSKDKLFFFLFKSGQYIKRFFGKNIREVWIDGLEALLTPSPPPARPWARRST